jgi:cytochrome c oxidase subunit 2
VAVAAVFTLAACAPQGEGPPSTLNPQGPAAEQIALAWWIMLGLATAVWLFVMGYLAWALARRRAPLPELDLRDDMPPRDVEATERALPGSPTHWIVGGGIVLPVAVIVILLTLTLITLRGLPGDAPGPEQQPVAALQQPAPGRVIEVIGRQWWWEVRYTNPDFETANEIHLPVGQPVTIRVTSIDVIHSFWIPELHGKIDAIPDRVNTIVLQADRPGEFRGECAEFCGIQHARMHLMAVAQPPAEFEAWLARESQDASVPSDAAEIEGQQVFLGSACVYCHTVRGTNATGDLGPDLTHLGSRLTLAAGTVPNTRGHLGGWIIDPQNLKPGNKMPPTSLSAEELQAILVYLESLE